MPGNVRELKKAIQRALFDCNGEEILPQHLPAHVYSCKERKARISPEIGTFLHEAESELILFTLPRTAKHRTAAVKLPGISRRAVYNKPGNFKIELQDPPQVSGQGLKG